MRLKKTIRKKKIRVAGVRERRRTRFHPRGELRTLSSRES
jgi:hypothetical protein